MNFWTKFGCSKDFQKATQDEIFKLVVKPMEEAKSFTLLLLRS